MKKDTGSLLAGIFLVAGTAIGGGMLALPVLTAEGGFWPTTLLYFLSWIFMASTGHLLMEVCLFYKNEVNIVTMAGNTLGLFGKIFAWIFYLFLFYSLTIAYVAGGGNLIGYAFGKETLSPLITSILFVLLFAPFVVFGPKAVTKINTLFVWGLLISFFLFVVLGINHVNSDFLKRVHFTKSFFALPVVFTSFGFQGVVPTLTNYLGRNPKKTAIAIWVGSFIPLLAYILWEALILGVVPLEGLLNAKICGETAVYPLKDFLQRPSLFLIGKFFAFFAIVTSFFGVTLGLTDFLSDGLHIKKQRQGKIYLALLVFLPPLLIALINPCLFLNALHYGGGFGCALLLGLLPILMYLSGKKKHKPHLPLPGGPFYLSLLLLFILFELVITFITLGN